MEANYAQIAITRFIVDSIFKQQNKVLKPEASLLIEQFKEKDEKSV